MKELSIEEKAKAYDEAIEKFDVILNLNTVKESGTISADDVRKIFPELKESEDEKIRKVLISQYQGNGCIRTNEYRIDYKNIRAWLEKQSEQKSIDDLTQQEAMDIAVAKCFEQDKQKPMNEKSLYKVGYLDGFEDGVRDAVIKEAESTDKVEPKFKIGDHIKPIDKCLGSSRIIEEVYDGWYVTDKGTLYFEFEDNWELVEKNPAWSEEDEQYITDTLNLLSFGCSIHSISEVQDFLLSLKDRYTWKPSDEQMERLKGTINSLPHQEVLYSLYQDLKKLKGE